MVNSFVYDVNNFKNDEYDVFYNEGKANGADGCFLYVKVDFHQTVKF